MDRLEDMMRLQLESAAIVQVDPTTLKDDERLQYFKDMILACTDELHEALGETGWKPWATSKHINQREAMGELRDAWQFLMNAMFVVTGLQPVELAATLHVMHAEKVDVNLKRKLEGYDGMTGKCRQCRRDLAEQMLKEVVSQNFTILYCACGNEISRLPS